MHPDDVAWIRRIPSGELERRLELWHVLDRVATAASRMGGQVAICGSFVGADVVEVRGAQPTEGRRCPSCQGQQIDDLTHVLTLAQGPVAVPVAVSPADEPEDRA